MSLQNRTESKLHPTEIVDERFAMGRIEIEPLEKRFAEIVDMQPMRRSRERVRHSLETFNV